MAVLAAAASQVGDPRCHTETTYHCVRVFTDPDRPSGRFLVLDTLNHSYVDLDDPSYLHFRYAKVFADVIAALVPPGPATTVHVGGGGFTFPRYLAAVRPGSTNVVLEIDAGLVGVARDRLGLRPMAGLDVRTGDARLLTRDLPVGGHDLVLGDAFGGVAVPWHLTTTEFATDVRAALGPGGAYVLNLIDRPPLRFAKAEVATLARVFADVVVIVVPDVLEAASVAGGSNIILAASDRAIDTGAITSAIVARAGQERVLTSAETAAFAAGAPVLTDDKAPVDQWLARAHSSS